MPKISNRVVDQLKVIRKKISDKKTKKDYLKNRSSPKLKKEQFPTTRNYSDYNKTFMPLLKRLNETNLINFISNRTKSKSLNVLDDGAGKGIFIQQIKQKLKEKGISSKTYAITLSKDISKKEREIDFLYNNYSESLSKKNNKLDFFPKQEMDVIFSVFGPLQYTIPKLQKNLLLKTVFSLKKGGYAFIGLDEKVLEHINTTPKQYLDSVKKSLNKNGFTMMYDFYVENRYVDDLPPLVMLIKRKE